MKTPQKKILPSLSSPETSPSFLNISGGLPRTSTKNILTGIRSASKTPSRPTYASNIAVTAPDGQGNSEERSSTGQCKTEILSMFFTSEVSTSDEDSGNPFFSSSKDGGGIFIKENRDGHKEVGTVPGSINFDPAQFRTDSKSSIFDEELGAFITDKDGDKMMTSSETADSDDIACDLFKEMTLGGRVIYLEESRIPYYKIRCNSFLFLQTFLATFLFFSPSSLFCYQLP